VDQLDHGHDTAWRESHPDLERLRRARRLRPGPFGFCQEIGPDAAAFARLSESVPLRSDLDFLLSTGSPAGRLYAAILLREVDPVGAQSVLAHLAGDPSRVVCDLPCSCTIVMTNVGAVARWLQAHAGSGFPAGAPETDREWMGELGSRRSDETDPPGENP